MNIKKLIEKWDELKDETKKQILALADKEIGKSYFVPEIDEYYYCYDYICSKGEIAAVKRMWANGKFDMFNEETGNCFKTEEEAIFAGSCDYYTKRYETYVNRHNEQLDWDNEEQEKYFIYYNDRRNSIEFDLHFTVKRLGIAYASSEQTLEDAITDIGEENFLKYVMKVEI